MLEDNKRKFLLMVKWKIEKELEGKYNNASHAKSARDYIQFFKNQSKLHYEVCLPDSGNLELGIHCEIDNGFNNKQLADDLLDKYKHIFNEVSKYGFEEAYVKVYGKKGYYWTTLKYQIQINDKNYNSYVDAIVNATSELIEKLDKAGANI